MRTTSVLAGLVLALSTTTYAEHHWLYGAKGHANPVIQYRGVRVASSSSSSVKSTSSSVKTSSSAAAVASSTSVKASSSVAAAASSSSVKAAANAVVVASSTSTSTTSTSSSSSSSSSSSTSSSTSIVASSTFATVVASTLMTSVSSAAPSSGSSTVMLSSVGSSSTSSSALSTTSLVANSACNNGPLTRSCWANGYSIATDFDLKWPTTGVTRYYTLTITNTTCSPDGSNARICLLFNNQLPGPTLWANWGDMISVTVINDMTANGTSTHFHGVRQLNTNPMDGVNGITECPLPPGSQETYLFHATQFGTSWYHSHFSTQYGDGLSGPIVISGPASANYDIDMGPLSLTEWYYDTAFQVEAQAFGAFGPPPPPNNILINGTNMNTAGTTGAYTVMKVTKGKKYRIRLINAAGDNALRVSIDGHTMQIITADFVPVQPITETYIMVHCGQRYDVIVSANQVAANYWMRVDVETACNSTNDGAGRAIFNYAGVALANPTSSPNSPLISTCNEPSPLTPWVPNNASNQADFISQANSMQVNLAVPGLSTNNYNVVVWGIDATAMDIQWEDPTVSYVMSGNTSYPTSAQVITIPNEGTWVYWIVQEVITGNPVKGPPISHPMHLHGHDFLVLGNGQGTFDMVNDPPNLTYTNPKRRDTVVLPAGGWVVIAFPADNPGAWLFHCHISRHASEGLGVQFLESPSTMPLPDAATYNAQCNAWDAFYATNYWKKYDSGL